MKSTGDFGLRTFNQLNGELITLDGIIRILPSVKMEIAAENLKSPFTSPLFMFILTVLAVFYKNMTGAFGFWLISSLALLFIFHNMNFVQLILSVSIHTVF
ncbi:hypothetical protein EG349_00080 [Chryseobacterium shandongense]|uniref:Uncharacterized protein n=1 Tax=Chryseobacterium shandongense TaxID=1493872 RepID=A0AAD0YA14_9FLAO|nr:hypothetical protein EG349_00080 [Chryseobacterium shandongense]AZA97410.1 hypothetical protein EG353_18555 [Chryseobacterium shandongense]